jgi:Zn-dependent metalloprotease
MRRKLMGLYEDNPAPFEDQVGHFVTDETFRNSRITFSKLNLQAKKAVAKECFPQEVAAPGPLREVYHAQNKEALPGELLRAEGDPETADADVNRAYDAAGHTWDFYYSLFERNSLDNAGMKIIQTVHYGTNYQNAFWNGKQMVYGDGDGKIFASFTSDIDVIGHELTHGVQQFETNLEYRDESGALNESLADVFGILIKQKVLNQDAAASDWLIGENVLIGDEYAIRSMKAPGTAYQNHPELGSDPQPSHMSGYTNDPYDNGGVHLNSGIPNHVFYLAATTVGGYAWEKVGRVWYAAMCDKALVPYNAGFSRFKEATLNKSVMLFGEGSLVTSAIREAWNNAGI